MDPELDAIFDAWDKAVGEGRDEDATRQLSDQYVADHPELFTQVADLSEDECVKALEVFRDAGFEQNWKLIQVYLWHKFEKKHVGGPLQQRLRIPGL